MKNKQRVIVAMSGGVDSSVAAALMKEEGHDVIGVFLKCWSETKNFRGECAWKEERRHAMRICMELKIPLVTIDAEREYKKYVVDEMFKDYKKGVTPNPDILCNEVVKFPFLLKIARKIKADFIVTGHYSRVREKNGKYELLRGKDEKKDQSYFLYRLNEKDLKKLLFPIGKYTKKEVRDIAKRKGFLNYNKKSTVGICFIGKIPMKDFLKTRIKSKEGNIVDPNGKIIGRHSGAYYYTIGQRLGKRNDAFFTKDETDRQNISRWYVAKKDIKKNEITAAPKGNKLLYRKDLLVKNFHLISEDKKDFLNKVSKKPLNVFSRIRSVGELIPSKVIYNKNEKKLIVSLNKAINGVSNGQAIVLYSKDVVLGGGVIS